MKNNGQLSTENLNAELNTTTVEKIGSNWYYNGYCIDENGNVEKYNKLLPKEYQQVEYIEIGEGGYIDTDIIPENHFLEIKFDWMTYKHDEHLFGTTEPGRSGVLGNYYHFTTWNMKYYWGNSNSESNVGQFSAGIHTLKYNYGTNYQVILDNEILGSGKQISTNTSGNYNLCIERRNNVSNFNGIIYYIRIQDKTSNNIVRDLIPCYTTTTVTELNSNTQYLKDTVGLYDLIESKFYTNKSTSGDFKAEPDV